MYSLDGRTSHVWRTRRPRIDNPTREKDLRTINVELVSIIYLSIYCTETTSVSSILMSSKSGCRFKTVYHIFTHTLPVLLYSYSSLLLFHRPRNAPSILTRYCVLSLNRLLRCFQKIREALTNKIDRLDCFPRDLFVGIALKSVWIIPKALSYWRSKTVIQL